MKYQVEYTPQAVEDLKGLRPAVRSLLYGWIEKNLVDCEDPRRYGSGDPEGSRWRYPIGEYRLLAEIQEGRVVILAVVCGLRRTGSRKNDGAQKPSLPPNVFLRSTLRQPVKTAMLLLVTALITFAFVARAAEYLLIKQETERLSGLYHAVGTVQPENTGSKLRTSEIVDYLENSPYVKTVEKVRYGSAVMEEATNVDADLSYVVDFMLADVFFYGTLERVSSSLIPMLGSSSGEQLISYKFYFTVDEVVAGYPEAIQEGDKVTLTNSHTDLIFPERQYSDLTFLADELEPGGRYLLRGEYYKQASSNQLRSGTEGGTFTFKPLAALSPSGSTGTTNVEDGIWYFPVEPGESADFNDPRLAGVAEAIQVIDSNQHSLSTVGSHDVSALVSAMKSSVGPYLLEGRWPDSEDDAEGRRVCVIHETLAAQRGFSVGDTLTLYLRDTSHMLYSYYGSSIYGADLTRLEEIETSDPEEYEIVGIFNAIDNYTWYGSGSAIFIPASAYPDSFLYGYTDMYRHFLPNIWFELDSPDMVHQFKVEAQEKLGRLGVQAAVEETGWENFQAAAKPMRQSSLVNALVFTGILLAVLGLLAVIYYRMRRKDIAIARALGVPVRQCVPQAALPLLLTGGLGILAGGWIGWRSTMENAGTVLRSLAEFGSLESAGLSDSWIAALCGAVLVLLAMLALCGAWLTARAPVLTLLQGGAAVQVQKPARPEPARQPVPQAARPAAIPAASSAAIPAPAAGRSLGAAHVLRFVWRHIARAKVKTALAVLLAAGFMAGMASIRIAIADSIVRVDELYDNTIVEMELVQDGSVNSATEYRRGSSSISNYISADAVNAVRDTGFIRDGYLEGAIAASVFLYDGEWVRGQSVSLSSGLTNVTVRYFNDLEESGIKPTMVYHTGWDGSLFSQDWAALDGETPDDAPALFPVVLPKTLYEEFGIQEGDTIGVYCGGFRLCEVAGYYSGNTALMPCSAVETMAGNKMAYSKAQFTLDPSQNRQIDQFQAAVDEIIAGTKSLLPLRMVVWDEELRYTVSPLEDSIALMELLYPVVLVLSLLVAAGIAVLFVMTSAKEAAIMRVLGTSRLRSRVMLALQTAFTSLGGLVVGLLGVLAYTARTRPDLFANLVGASEFCAVLYLLAAIVGSAASASVVTGRNPLELLQVKE